MPKLVHVYSRRKAPTSQTHTRRLVGFRVSRQAMHSKAKERAEEQEQRKREHRDLS